MQICSTPFGLVSAALGFREIISIHRVSRDEFDSLKIEKMGFFPEKSWFRGSEIDIAGTVIKDPIDKDWSYVIVAKDEDEFYRYIKGKVSLPSQEDAEGQIFSEMSLLDERGTCEEELYSEAEESSPDETQAVITREFGTGTT